MAGRWDKLLFVFGFILFILLVVQSTLGIFRYHNRVVKLFQFYHAILAAVLILIASAHWWPFVIFLAPAIACTAASSALRRGQHDGPRMAALALASSTAVTGTGIAFVWAARQVWILIHPSQYYSLPLFIFPVACVVVAFTTAHLSTRIICHFVKVNQVRNSSSILDSLL